MTEISKLHTVMCVVVFFNCKWCLIFSLLRRLRNCLTEIARNSFSRNKWKSTNHYFAKLIYKPQPAGLRCLSSQPCHQEKMLVLFHYIVLVLCKPWICSMLPFLHPVRTSDVLQRPTRRASDVILRLLGNDITLNVIQNEPKELTVS